MKKSLIFALILIIAVAFVFSSCGKGKTKFEPEEPITTPTSPADIARTKIGSGEKEFIWEYSGKDGEIKSFVVATDDSTVGNALRNYGLMTFATDDEGNKSISVNGVEIPGNSKWQFFENGTISYVDPCNTVIQSGSVYSFVCTK